MSRGSQVVAECDVVVVVIKGRNQRSSKDAAECDVVEASAMSSRSQVVIRGRRSLSSQITIEGRGLGQRTQKVKQSIAAPSSQSEDEDDSAMMGENHLFGGWQKVKQIIAVLRK